ncbi:MAG: molybdate ABC transporter substrate-binding protein [Oscillospiraceae bacterium]|nr:molybdate ABC transporter substrate-binding protein [Oscillospiraceae bacterium]
MKKKLAFLLAVLALVTPLILPGCGQASDDETEIIVFAAASMAGVLTEIAGIYQDENPDVNLIFNFDSSGTLRTQIQEGAQADLFVSAATREMDQLEEGGFVQPGTRVDFLENQTVLVVPDNNPRGIESFADMVEALLSGDVLMAMGNMDVPAGRYAQEILLYFGLDHAELAATGVISYASNVREVALQVREASVDMGIVYLTDAVDHNLTVADIAAPEISGRVIYPAAVLNDSQNPKEARDFLDFLVGDTAMEVFVAWGFSPFAQ